MTGGALPAARGEGRALTRAEPALPLLDPIPADAGRSRRDREFHPSDIELIEHPGSPITRWVVVSLLALVGAAFLWSYFGRISDFATASGKVQVVGRTKVVEPDADGQVTRILVRDGDRVAAGAPLVELDSTEAAAQSAIVASRLAENRAESVIRAAALKAGRSDPVDTAPALAWPADVSPPVRLREEQVLRAELAKLDAVLANLRSQRRAKEAERDKDKGSIAAQKNLIAVTAENQTMSETLQQSGWNSRAKLLDLISTQRQQEVTLKAQEGALADAEAALPVIDGAIVTARETYLSANTQQFIAAEHNVNELTQQATKAAWTLGTMTLRAPVAGTVHASAVTTVGQVVKARQQVMQILPDGVSLEVEAYLQNGDVGLVKTGQSALVKVDTFHYSTYGGVTGTVVKVAKDSIALPGKTSLQAASLDGVYSSATAALQTGTLRFPMTIALDRTSIQVNGKPVDLVPGMSVSVEVETERRRAIDYVVSPLLDLLSSSIHER